MVEQVLRVALLEVVAPVRAELRVRAVQLHLQELTHGLQADAVDRDLPVGPVDQSVVAVADEELRGILVHVLVAPLAFAGIRVHERVHTTGHGHHELVLADGLLEAHDPSDLDGHADDQVGLLLTAGEAALEDDVAERELQHLDAGLGAVGVVVGGHEDLPC